MNPLQNIKNIPTTGPGSFGAIRKHDIHTGIDFYCDLHDEVYAIQDGVVVSIQAFTGVNADCAWWNDTDCVIVKCDDGNYILYGEITSLVNENQKIKKGDIIGKVITVLKHDKGLPMNMLHLEYYNKNFDLNPVVWELNEEQPNTLLNPETLFK